MNAQVDALISTGVLRRRLAFTELKFSNSMIEAWWRSLKHQWLFLHSLDSMAAVRRLVAFYVDEHNRVLPHSAFRGQTPDEMYFGTGDTIPVDLMSCATAARRARVEANRPASCANCPSVEAPPDHCSDHVEHRHASGGEAENRRPHVAPVEGQKVSGRAFEIGVAAVGEPLAT